MKTIATKLVQIYHKLAFRCIDTSIIVDYGSREDCRLQFSIRGDFICSVHKIVLRSPKFSILEEKSGFRTAQYWGEASPAATPLTIKCRTLMKEQFNDVH